MDSGHGHSGPSDVIVVKDAWRMLQLVLVVLVLCIGTVAAILGGFGVFGGGFRPDGFIWALAALVLALPFLFHLMALFGGVVLDVENDSLSFAGGGISPSGPGDFFRADFLLQPFRRYEIGLSEIRNIKATDTRYYDKVSREVKYWHHISFNGDFGAVSLRFVDENKRDQLYAAIREANRMGSPVVMG